MDMKKLFMGLLFFSGALTGVILYKLLFISSEDKYYADKLYHVVHYEPYDDYEFIYCLVEEIKQEMKEDGYSNAKIDMMCKNSGLIPPEKYYTSDEYFAHAEIENKRFEREKATEYYANLLRCIYNMHLSNKTDSSYDIEEVNKFMKQYGFSDSEIEVMDHKANVKAEACVYRIIKIPLEPYK